MSIADELIKRGWTTGVFEDDEGRVCVQGAAIYACGFSSIEKYTEAQNDVGPCRDKLDQVDRALTLLSDLAAGRGSITSATFNDAEDRTYDEVLRLAKEADELLEAENE